MTGDTDDRAGRPEGTTRGTGERGPDPRRLVITVNAAWNLVNFRAGLIRALISDGWEVVAAAPDDPGQRAALEAMGCRFVPIEMTSRGMSVVHDLRVLLAFRRLFRLERPAAMLGYTIKPNIYGSVAARWSGVPTINNISGLGTGFMRAGPLQRLVVLLYRLGLKGSHTVFFQNEDDRALFVARRMVRAEQTALLPGSGIDLHRFGPAPPPDPARPGPTFLMIARLVYDKGVREFVEAARIVRQQRPDARFVLLGFLGVDNQTAVAADDVAAWEAEGVLTYHPPTDDVRPAIADADVVVLPSYREGTSRVLLEAAAMARPIVATDVPGCREVVEDGISGLLCPVRDAEGLALAMLRMCDATPAERAAMGAAGRAKVEREYDEALVIAAYRARLALMSRGR